MTYVRHNLITFDSEKRSAMVSQLTTQLDNAKEIPGLMAVRVHFDTIQGSDNRLCISGFYDDKKAAESAQERVKAELSRLSEFIVGEPAVREGEIIWSFDADGAPSVRQIVDGYMRHTTVGFIPSKLDSFLAYADSIVGTLNAISGLRRIRVATVKGPSQIYKSEDRLTVSSAFDSKEAADAATEQTASIWAGMSEFMPDDPERRVVGGDLIYAYSR